MGRRGEGGKGRRDGEVCVKGGTEGWRSKVRRGGNEGKRTELEGNLGRRGGNEGSGG